MKAVCCDGHNGHYSKTSTVLLKNVYLVSWYEIQYRVAASGSTNHAEDKSLGPSVIAIDHFIGSTRDDNKLHFIDSPLADCNRLFHWFDRSHLVVIYLLDLEAETPRKSSRFFLLSTVF